MSREPAARRIRHRLRVPVFLGDVHAVRPNSWRSERARGARLVRIHAPKSEIAESKRNYRALRLADHVENWLAADPPLNDEQRSRIADLLLSGGGAQ